MTAAEGQRFHMIMLQICRALESAHRLRTSGLLSSDDWRFQLIVIRNLKGFSSFQNWWVAANQYFDAPFRAVVEWADIGAPVIYDQATERFVARSILEP